MIISSKFFLIGLLVVPVIFAIFWDDDSDVKCATDAEVVSEYAAKFYQTLYRYNFSEINPKLFFSPLIEVRLLYTLYRMNFDKTMKEIARLLYGNEVCARRSNMTKFLGDAILEPNDFSKYSPDRGSVFFNLSIRPYFKFEDCGWGNSFSECWPHSFSTYSSLYFREERRYFYRFGQKKKPKKVPFFVTENTFGYASFPDVHAISMNISSRTNMIIVLPKKYDGIYELSENLNGTFLHSLFDATNNEKEVRLAFPKFGFNTKKIETKPIYKKLGMKRLYSCIADIRPDYGGVGTNGGRYKLTLTEFQATLNMNYSEPDYIKKSRSRNILEIQISTRKSFPKWIPFVADHPFIFIIANNADKRIIHMGVIFS